MATDQTPEKKYPPLEPDWQTASARAKVVGGTVNRHNRDMYRLRKRLIVTATQAIGGDREQAEALVDLHYVGFRQSPNGKVVIAVSPKAQSLLPKRPSRLEPDWVNGNMLAREIKGNASVHNANIIRLREQFIDEVTEQYTHDRKEAAALVSRHLTRVCLPANGKGPAAMALSPDARKSLPPRFPLLEKGWQTANMRKEALGGDDRTYSIQLRKLREELIDVISEQYTHDRKEAEGLVERYLIGMRQHQKGPPMLAASPEAQELLPKGYPFLEKDWQTGRARAKAIGGSRNTYDTALRMLHDSLIEEITEKVTHGDTEEAEGLVHHHLVGMRQLSGPATMAGSPEVQRIMDEPEHSGWVSRMRKPPRSKTNKKTLA